MQNEPTLLGEKLAQVQNQASDQADRGPLRSQPRAVRVLFGVAHIALLTAVTCLPLWWALIRPDMSLAAGLGPCLLIVLWLFVAHKKDRQPRLKQTAATPHRHPLLAGDRQGFIGNLRLDAKSVIIDGSNIYHFGQNHGFGTRPLALVVQHLRAESYRVVCFFDANIFYRLEEHGIIPKGQPHLPAVLGTVFGLRRDEIYVVPSGVDADEYILMTLNHLPHSFALTNDRYRDYAKRFGRVMKGDLWRKGLVLSNNEIKILQHRLRDPIRLSA